MNRYQQSRIKLPKGWKPVTFAECQAQLEKETLKAMEEVGYNCLTDEQKTIIDGIQP